jgi:hypothetical protein
MRGEIGLFFLIAPLARVQSARERSARARKDIGGSERGARRRFIPRRVFLFLSLSSCVLPDGRYATYPFFLGSVFSSSVSLWSSSKIFKNSFFLLSTTLNERARLAREKKNTSRMTNANRTVISIVCLVHLQLTFINLFSFLLHL